MRSIPFKDGNTPTTQLVVTAEVRITEAAVRVGDIVYLGWRHANIMNEIRIAGLATYINSEQQGFVDQSGNFWNRWQAARIADYAKQLNTKRRDELLSEDVWDNEGVPHMPVNYEHGDY